MSKCVYKWGKVVYEVRLKKELAKWTQAYFERVVIRHSGKDVTYFVRETPIKLIGKV